MFLWWNEGDKKAYIRIADTINELAFIGGVNGNTTERLRYRDRTDNLHMYYAYAY